MRNREGGTTIYVYSHQIRYVCVRQVRSPAPNAEFNGEYDEMFALSERRFASLSGSLEVDDAQ